MDRVIATATEANVPVEGRNRPHVVIVGAGFGGLAAARALGGHAVDVTVIDRRNHHLFQPLLYQVATAALSPADIAEPIRHILSRHANIEVLLGEVCGIDTAQRQVLLTDGASIAYDRLILASGSRPSYFGHDRWSAAAPSLKSLEDAQAIRGRLLTAFEQAERAATDQDRRRLMRIVVVGGGPTGVELAGSIAELARHALARDFRQIDPTEAEVLLVEATDRILGAFPEELSDYATGKLERLGVQVFTGQSVGRIDDSGVTIEGRHIPAATVIWGAGVTASPAARWLGIEPDRVGRVPVQPDLGVVGVEGVYALGDTARCADPAGQPLPGLAQVAQQQGEYLGRALVTSAATGERVAPFVFRNRGYAAIVGRHAAVFDFGHWRLKGYFAWVLWALVHVVLLVGFERRLRVSLQWLWRYLTYQRGARLITTAPPAREPGGPINGRDGG